MSRSRIVRTIGVRFALIGFGLVCAGLALEVLLQSAAVYTQLSGRALPTTAFTSRPKVMCLGDSNTFGIYLRRDQTYPHYLEQLWNMASPTRPIEMLNFGFPGLNSSKLRKNLPGLLESFHPELVLLLVGANDPITVPVPIDSTTAGASPLSMLWRYSRTFRFLYMLVHGVQHYRVDYRREERVGAVQVDGREFDLIGTERTSFSQSDEWKRDLQANLRAMVQTVQASGARAVLLTYASHQLFYGIANEVARAAAIAENVPLIDLESDFRLLCPGGRCVKIFFEDQHPNSLGYELVAAIAWRELHLLAVAPGDDMERALSELDPKATEMLSRLDITHRDAASDRRNQF